MSLKKRRKHHSPVIQIHHILYNPEVTVAIWKGEHWLITMLGRRKRVSKGFIKALKLWIREHEKRAVELKL